jgi:spoIIIJ-associated protein
MRQRFEGRNLEQALENAAASFGVPRFQVAYSVVVEKRGFLGGIKRVVIEATVDEDAQPPVQQEPIFKSPMADTPAAPSAGRRDSGGPRGRGGRSAGRDDRGRSSGRRERGGERRGRSEERRPRRSTATLVDEPAPEQGERSAYAAAVAEWAGELLRLGEFDVELRTEESGDEVNVRLYGEEARQFAENDGELLDSIQTLANKAFSEKEEFKKIEFDALRAKEHRAVDLEKRAREAADRVRSDGREQLLPAMNPTERRIVHMVLADDPEVMTISRGDGFHKRVAIVLRGSDAEAER